jgi:prepilin-type processing-associated H-X9-DG protein
VPHPVKITAVQSTASTILFADALGVDSFSTPQRQTNPVFIETPLMEPPSFTYPTVHFRHGGTTANVLFLDGHVESMVPTINPPSSFETPPVTAMRTLFKIFDIGSDDRLWDRD